MNPRSGRQGATLLELVVALTVASVVLAPAGTAVVAQIASARRAAADVADGEALRSASLLLAAETRWLGPADVDAAADAVDSLSMRAFRGIAVICERADSDLWAAVWATRAPDPSKDSLLWVQADGLETASAVTFVGVAPPPGSGCASALSADSAAVYRLRVSPVPAAAKLGALAELFEHGVYSVSAGALRYRRGGGGRQPVTDQRFDTTAAPLALERRPAVLPSGSTAVAVPVAAVLDVRSVQAEPGLHGAHRTVRRRLPFFNARPGGT